MSPGQADGFLTAYEAGGENGALQWLSGNANIYGMDSWGFGAVDSLQIGDLNTGF